MDQEKIWDYFQNDDATTDAFAGARTRYKFLSRHINPGMRVLNIGVGRGGLEAILLQKGAIVSCLDPSEKSIENIRELLGLGDRAQVGYSQAMPFTDHHFEVVVMSEVIEHLTDEELRATLSEVLRVLESGGRFIGTVPADENLLANQIMCPHCGQTSHRWGHIQTFNRSSLEQILGRCFDKVKLSRHFFGDVHSLNWKGRISSVIKKIMVGMGMAGSGESYFFSVLKK
jgi:ubiquinone/menaquinone biosynthesis C-methylase UbiE